MAYLGNKSENPIDINKLQQTASNPAYSVWVSASAGSGKTKVLTDRVLRLLLAGSEPSKILCLTFTKAAASEMKLRIQSILSHWSILKNSELTKELRALMGQDPSLETLHKASTLFHNVIDASPSIRIQTIHAFCQKILKQFPLEANISPHFEAMDEQGAKLLLNESYDDLFSPSNLKGDFKKALDYFAPLIGLDGFQKLCNSALREKEKLSQLPNWEKVEPHYKNLLNLPDHLQHFYLEEDTQNLLFRIKEAAYKGSNKDQTKAAFLEDFLRDSKIIKIKKRATLFALFLKQDGNLRQTILTKKALNDDPSLKEKLFELAEKLQLFNQQIKAFELLKANHYFFIIAQHITHAYEKRKFIKSALDYDDLILKTADLLNRSSGAHWVLYKLDYGIDHILVDEAQDTNAAQWRIISALAEEFFSGASSRTDNRTLFIVGDEKQSIYRFQGAHPEIFIHLKTKFEKLVKDAGKQWRVINLNISFRSTRAILDLVDRIFSASELQQSVLGAEVSHQAYRSTAWGHVELWPLISDNKEKGAPTPSAWENPLTRRPYYTSHYRFALAIAKNIQNWLSVEKYLPSKKRTIQPKDIMILLRKRDGFFHMLIRVLKQQNIPISGTDRMLLGEQLVVEDLICLGQWLLFPNDDLMLATLLKTPLLGLNESQIFELAQGRSSSLWQALKEKTKDKATRQNSLFKLAYDYLKTLLGKLDFLSVFELYQMLLNQACPQSKISGYDAFMRRLGKDIEDPIESFLNLLSNYEQKQDASLQNFIAFFENDSLEIKKERHAEHDAVQIMTIHGSKGLQAPIVILPDTTSLPRTLPQLYWHSSKTAQMQLPFFLIGEGNKSHFADALKTEERTRQLEEYYRLLYVALTRAEDELYMGSSLALSEDRAGDKSWYTHLTRAMESIGEPHCFEQSPDGDIDGDGFIYQTGYPLGENPITPLENKPVIDQKIPKWALEKAPKEKMAPHILNPSLISVEKMKALSPFAMKQDEWRFKRGNLIHKLLQILPDVPPIDRSQIGRQYLQTPSHHLNSQQVESWLSEALSILNHPKFSAVFGPKSEAEVPLVGKINGQKISAQIDRLVVDGNKILLIDYKTNRPSPNSIKEVPDYYLEQMALYKKLLENYYPGKKVEAAFIWTEMARLMTIN